METAVERKHLLMQTEFQSPPPPLRLSDGETSSDVRAAYMSGLCAGLRFRSLLTHGSFDPAAEPYLFTMCDAVSVEAPPFNFFPDSENFPSHNYQQLPELHSLEPPPHYAAGCLQPVETASYKTPKLSPRKRRSDQKLSEKTWRLQKLLPWNKRKMDMATILEEAYKYIKFLQAQTRVLQGMPICDGGGDATYVESSGDLERLSRQQLLQVVVNSPVAQAQLYSKGCCVFSMEQMVLIKKKAERKAILHQMLLDDDTNFIMLS